MHCSHPGCRRRSPAFSHRPGPRPSHPHFTCRGEFHCPKVRVCAPHLRILRLRVGKFAFWTRRGASRADGWTEWACHDAACLGTLFCVRVCAPVDLNVRVCGQTTLNVQFCGPNTACCGIRHQSRTGVLRAQRAARRGCRAGRQRVDGRWRVSPSSSGLIVGMDVVCTWMVAVRSALRPPNPGTLIIGASGRLQR